VPPIALHFLERVEHHFKRNLKINNILGAGDKRKGCHGARDIMHVAIA
jgi:hypothetical protein